jgi:hypothetical protein
VLLLLGACGGGESDLSGPPCEQLAQRMCNAARDCAADPDAQGACRWQYNQQSELGRNCSVCEFGLVERFCQDPTKTPSMIDACAAALDTATCDLNTDNEDVVVLPEACDAVIVCNEGPCTQ